MADTSHSLLIYISELLPDSLILLSTADTVTTLATLAESNLHHQLIQSGCPESLEISYNKLLLSEQSHCTKFLKWPAPCFCGGLERTRLWWLEVGSRWGAEAKVMAGPQASTGLMLGGLAEGVAIPPHEVV